MKSKIFILLSLFLMACVRVPEQTTSTQSPVITQHITIIENSTITGADVAGLNIDDQDQAPTQTTTTNEEHGRNNWIFYTIALIAFMFVGWMLINKIKKVKP